ncbi:MAG: hypothetical protein ABFD54_02405 [Armatimonadota bacterium]|nr:hypothetical protein [bacterium]
MSWRTIKNRKFTINQLLQFLESKGYDQCGLLELKQYFSYLSSGHEDPNGRWRNAHLIKRVRPCTVQTYYITLRTFFRYLEAEWVIEASPVESIKLPVCRPDQIFLHSTIVDDVWQISYSTGGGIDCRWN